MVAREHYGSVTVRFSDFDYGDDRLEGIRFNGERYRRLIAK